MKRLFTFTALVMLLLAGSKVGAADGLSPEDEAFLRGLSQDYFKITSSIFVSFTSQTGVTQGGFVLDGEAGEDFKMDVVTLRLRYFFSTQEISILPFLKL